MKYGSSINSPDSIGKPAAIKTSLLHNLQPCSAQKDWMLRAINRGDDIYIASPINETSLINKDKFGKQFGSYFANELNELILANVKPINISQSEWELLKPLIVKAAGTKK